MLKKQVLIGFLLVFTVLFSSCGILGEGNAATVNILNETDVEVIQLGYSYTGYDCDCYFESDPITFGREGESPFGKGETYSLKIVSGLSQGHGIPVDFRLEVYAELGESGEPVTVSFSHSAKQREVYEKRLVGNSKTGYRFV